MSTSAKVKSQTLYNPAKDSTGVPTKMLTVNVSLKISVYNPATLFGIHVSSTPVNLVYSEIVVATGQVNNSVRQCFRSYVCVLVVSQ